MGISFLPKQAARQQSKADRFDPVDEKTNRRRRCAERGIIAVVRRLSDETGDAATRKRRTKLKRMRCEENGTRAVVAENLSSSGRRT